MNSRYCLSKVAGFYEVFDWREKETVFASEERSKAVVALNSLNKTGSINKRLTEVK